jgi:alcohol dehydrogenase
MPHAAVFHGADKPVEYATFAPHAPVGTEILVRITLCTLCRSDLHTHSGRRIEPTPTVLGHEIVGTIEAFGPDAPQHDGEGRPVYIGSRITWAIAVGCGACFFCTDDLPQKCERPYKYGHQRVTAEHALTGGLAESIVLVPGTVFFLVPESLSDAMAAPANCATATVAAMLRYGGIVSGRTVLILGGGMLGVTAAAMARTTGANAVIVSDGVAASRERALVFGATHAVSADPEQIGATVHSATNGRGADLVLELAGSAQTVQTGIDMTRIGGTVVLAGTVGPVGNIALDPERAVRRMLTVRGVHNYHPRDLAAALRFLSGPGNVFPWESLVVATYPLERAEEAFADANSRPGVRVAVSPIR